MGLAFLFVWQLPVSRQRRTLVSPSPFAAIDVCPPGSSFICHPLGQIATRSVMMLKIHVAYPLKSQFRDLHWCGVSSDGLCGLSLR